MVGQPEGTRLISRGDQGPDRYSYGTIKYESLEPQASRCLCTKRDTIIVSLVALGVCILITVSLALGLPKIHEKHLEYLDVSFSESSSPLVSFDKAVVVTDGGPCADIGKDILKNGGTAVDAAIAALFCGGVVNPQSMGFGGGFLMTVFIKQDNMSAVVDAREVAPLNAFRDMFEGNSKLSQEGGLSIAVPGELMGYWTAHQSFGKTPWKQLIEPSIQLCIHGFKVSAHLAKNLQKVKTKIMADDSMRKEFINNKTNDLYKEGEIFKRPILGITLNEIAIKGAEVIYAGDLSQSFLEDISKCGGIINQTDLKSYKVNVNLAIKVKLESPKPLVLHTVPPPGSGLILSTILNILSNYNMTSQDFEDVDTAVLQYHRIVEAFKFAFAQRTQLGDGEFLNLTELVSNLKSKAFADSLAKQISDAVTYPPKFYKPVMDTLDDHGTAHVSVLAENGDAVSVTSTINSHFGSLCLSPSTGIILNNAMDDFSSPNIVNYFGVPPSPANYIVPGKRPLSSMCPSIAVNSNGDVEMIAGGAGGTRMITSSALAILRTLWLGEDIKKATDAPRIHHQLFPNTIQHEPEFPKLYLDKLKLYGHSVQLDSHASVFLGIIRQDGKLKTNVDYRKGGSASGY